MLGCESLICEILESNDNYVNRLVKNCDAETLPTLAKLLAVPNRTFHAHIKRILEKHAAGIAQLLHLHEKVPTYILRTVFAQPTHICTINTVSSVTGYLHQRSVGNDQFEFLLTFLWGVILRLHTVAENERMSIFRCIDMDVISGEDLNVGPLLVGHTEERYLQHCRWLAAIELNGNNSVDETFEITSKTTEALRMLTGYRHLRGSKTRTIPVYVLKTFANLCTSSELCKTRLSDSNSFFSLLCFVRYHISTLHFDNVQFHIFLLHSRSVLTGVTKPEERDITLRQLLNMIVDSMQAVVENTETASYSYKLFLEVVFLVVRVAKLNQFPQHLVSIWALVTGFVHMTKKEETASEFIFSHLLEEHFACIEALGPTVPTALEFHNLRWLAGARIPGVAKHVLIRNLLQHLQVQRGRQHGVKATCSCFDTLVYYIEMFGGVLVRNQTDIGLYETSIVIARRILVKRYFMTEFYAFETDILCCVVRFLNRMIKWTGLERCMFKNDFLQNTICDVAATLDETIDLFAFECTEHLIPNASEFLHLTSRLVHTAKISPVPFKASTMCTLVSMALRWEFRKTSYALFSQQICTCIRFMQRTHNVNFSLSDFSFVGSECDLNGISSDTCNALLSVLTLVAVRGHPSHAQLEKTFGAIPEHMLPNGVVKYALFQALVSSHKQQQVRRAYSETWASFLKFVMRATAEHSEREMYYELRFIAFFFLLTKTSDRTDAVLDVAACLNGMHAKYRAYFSERVFLQWLKVANILFIAWPQHSDMHLRNALIKVVEECDAVQSPRISELRAQILFFTAHACDLAESCKQKLFALCFQPARHLDENNPVETVLTRP